MRSRSVRKRLHKNQFLRFAWRVRAVAASVECVVNSGSRIRQFAGPSRVGAVLSYFGSRQPNVQIARGVFSLRCLVMRRMNVLG